MGCDPATVDAMSSAENRLGDYLRARRELVSPEDVGLPASGTRRVTGLRREEVAMLAGISADYYLRLEQGRDRNPSLQVLESIARVLHLDAVATEHLLTLAATRPRARRRPRREVVPASTAMLVNGLPNLPSSRAATSTSSMANPLATVLSPAIRPGNNRLRSMFLDPAERALWPDWEAATATFVAGFRESLRGEIDDPRVIELVGELSLASEQFRRLWARHDVAQRRGAPARVRHPQVGDLLLHREKLAIAGTDGQTLVVYHAEQGTPNAEKLALMATLATPTRDPSAETSRTSG